MGDTVVTMSNSAIAISEGAMVMYFLSPVMGFVAVTSPGTLGSTISPVKKSTNSIHSPVTGTDFDMFSYVMLSPRTQT